MDDITFFAETTFRNMRKKFGIKTDDRRRHLYVVGKTGMGKTVMMENLAIQDIQEGRGVGFVDPHGEAAEKLLDFVPKNRINDVVYVNPADLEWPIAFNIMEKVDLKYRHLVSGGLMGVFKKIWPDVWSARMEYILNYCILALLEYPGATLLGVNRMLSDIEYRKKVVDRITDPVVKAFWITEYARYTQRYEVEATAAIQNKVGQLVSTPLIRNIVSQVRTAISMREVMDKQKILIMNLSKGRMGEDSSRLLGALLITKLQLAAMARVDIPEEERKDFFLYVDEFQNFATEAFCNILSEARKYRLCLTLGNQYIAQLEEMTAAGKSARVRDAVFGNVGTIITFRVGAEDAEFLEKEFMPEFLATDIVNLAKYNIYLKLMIDGLAGRPFSAHTLPPALKPKEPHKEKIIELCRERYTISRKVIEEKIARWTGVSKSLSEPQQQRQQQQPVLYDARCSVCGKDTKVVFQPDGSRPIYCRPCRKKTEASNAPKSPDASKPSETLKPADVSSSNVIKSSEAPRSSDFSKTPNALEAPANQTISLQEVFKKEPIPFSFSRKFKEERQKPKRKEIDIEELKKTLKESLEKSKNNRPGEINREISR